MCGRFGSAKKLEDLVKHYNGVLASGTEFNPSYNVAPTESVPIVREWEDHREIRLASFGIPKVMGAKKFSLLNIQSEKASNRNDFKDRRCVIPVTGFYEWEKVSPKDKQPYYFSPKDELLSFAGLWKPGEKGLAFTILTTSANELVESVHGRMPVILSHNAVGQWLAPDSDTDTLKELMQPYPAGLMQAWKVSKAVNSPKNKDASCINSI